MTLVNSKGLLYKYYEMVRGKFLFLWFSQILSAFTINILNFVLLLKLFSLTGSTIAASMVYLAYALPAIFIGPFASVLVDTVDRKKILIIANICQAGSVLMFAITPSVSPFLLYSLAFAYSFFNQFYFPAEAASLPTLVSRESLPKANGLFFLTQQASLAIGFGLGGILDKLLGFTNTLFLSSFLLSTAFVSSTFLPSSPVLQKRKEVLGEQVKKYAEMVLEGYNFIKNNRRILLPFLIFLGLQVGLMVVAINIPAISRDILKVNPNEAGFLLIAPGAIGAFSGAILIPKILAIGKRKKTIIEVGMFLISFVFISFITALPFMSQVLRQIISFLLMIVGGAAFSGILIPVQTFLQEGTPPNLYGRVFGNMWFLVTLTTVFPVFFSGIITDILGVRPFLIIMTLFVLSALIVSRKFGQSFLEGTEHEG